MVALLLIAGCGAGTGEPGAVDRATDAGRVRDEWFTERAAETGLDFVHVNGATPSSLGQR